MVEISATSTLMPAGFNSIAVRSAAILNEPLRKLPQMPSTLMPPASLMLSSGGGDPESENWAQRLTQPEGRDKAHGAGAGAATSSSGGRTFWNFSSRRMS